MCVCQFLLELEHSVDAPGLLLPGLFGEEKGKAPPVQGPGSCCSAQLLIRQIPHLLWGLSPGVSLLLTPRPQEGTWPARALLCWGGFLAR